MPGAPGFEHNRIGILGRAKGEPVIFVRAPKASEPHWPPKFAQEVKRLGLAGSRKLIYRALRRYRGKPEVLRKILLREGYIYAETGPMALALTRSLTLPKLFKAQTVYLQRGQTTYKLERKRVRRRVFYQYADGPREGSEAQLLFADRVGFTKAELSTPLHRELTQSAEAFGFSRFRARAHYDQGSIADIRMGKLWGKALFRRGAGPGLEFRCWLEKGDKRAQLVAAQKVQSPRREALRKLQASVDKQVAERLRFDRPFGEKGPLRDGQLRPVWYQAYRLGQKHFYVDEHAYPVFTPKGEPWPPQVCVDFVLDSYERTHGTWFLPKAKKPQRVSGRLDFNQLGIKNRRSVLAFGRYAEAHPELFHFRKFQGKERIKFQYRARFFAFLLHNADAFQPGDVLAIRGRKGDGRIHQHAILLARTDPVTGFPYGLADQMRWPRRRTWEGIMAEAPLRSLRFRARPTARVMLAEGSTDGPAAGLKAKP